MSFSGRARSVVPAFKEVSPPRAQPAEQADKAPEAPAAAPAASRRLREMPFMFVPGFLVHGSDGAFVRCRSRCSMNRDAGKVAQIRTCSRPVTNIAGP